MLTDTAIKAAKPSDKPYKLSDEKGLYLLVQTQGGKLWRFDYRFETKRKTLALGKYPEISLKQARARLDDARKLLAEGTDPSELRKAEKITKSEAKTKEEKDAASTFEAVAREWFANQEPTWAPAHAEKVINRLKNNVFPYIGQKPISEISAPEILEIIRRIEARGTTDTAHRAKQNVGQVMRYAIATGRATYDPTPSLTGALKPKSKGHFAAITEPKDIAPILRMIAGYKGTPITKAALTIAPLVFVRPGELRAMLWSDIDFDACEWRYTTSKTHQDHLVPLSRQVIDALRELQPLTGHSRYVFTGARSDTRPMSENTVNGALKRLGIDTQTEITGHGFRALARTVLDEVHGFRPEVIELQLAHAVRDPLGRAYNRTQHLAERKKMMQIWADYLDELRDS